MIINETQFNCEVEQILEELISQCRLNNLPYLSKGYKQSGDHLMIQCPYHANGQERRPSAGIRLSDGIFHCFTCGEVHSLPEVISQCLGYNDAFGKEGFKWLLKNFATVQVEERKDVELDFKRPILDSVSNYSNHFVSEKELDSYRYVHPYMYERKLTDEVIEIFDIGYDSATDCLTFPVRDVLGNVLFIARRSVRSKFFSYPKQVEKPLYGLYELFHYGADEDSIGDGIYQYTFPTEVIVCESMLDALTCWVYGKQAVAFNGLGTELQFKQLRDLPCRKLILATDNDDAGMKARKRIRQNVPNKMVTEYILPNDKKDINELSKEEFDNLIEVF